MTTIETPKQTRARHDVHLLHLLTQFTKKATKLEITYSEEFDKERYGKEGHRSLRFRTTVPDEVDPIFEGKSYLRIGVGSITTTGLFYTGHHVLHFFCFYPHRQNLNEDDSKALFNRDHLYNSCLYIYRKPWFGFGPESSDLMKCLKPYRKTWWQRFVKGFNDLFRSPTSCLWYFRNHDDEEVNKELDIALQKAVFKAIDLLEKQQRAEQVAGIY
jgi:hypothetical protein